MTAPEFSRTVDIRQSDGSRQKLTANEAERAALAHRFGLVRIDSLDADVTLERSGSIVSVSGSLTARIVQSCAVSAEDLPVSIHEELSFRFVPASDHGQLDQEIELEPEQLDEIEYSGSVFDLGEAVAQGLALAIDPFATGEQAEEARRSSGLLDEQDTGPFAALKGLKLKK